MSYKSTRRQWVKLWVNEWLDGTTRFELTAPQRLLWVDLLALAGRSRFPGFVYAGTGQGDKKMGYPIAYLAGVLQMNEIDLNNALKLLEAHQHITLEETGPDQFVVGIINWEKYQSEYLRQKGYRITNPEKISAKQAVNKAVKDGSLVKSGTCEKCGASGRIEGHHPDYTRPLEVVWLCSPCHRRVTTDGTSRLLVEGEKKEIRGREEVEGEVKDSAAAFSAIGFDKAFGYPKFKGVFLDHWKNRLPDQWVTQIMEDVIQDCQNFGIKVPPQFYDAKRDVEARENAQVERKVPL